MKTMKLLIVVLFCFGFMQVEAQLRLGAEVGIDLSSVNVVTNHTQIGSNGGVSVDYTFKNKINLATGIYHTMKGANTVCADSYGYEMLVRLGYVELPLMIGYRIPVASNIYLTPTIGGYLAWGVNGYGEFEKNRVFDDPNEFMNITEWSNPFKNHYYKTASGSGIVNAFNRFDGGLRFGLNADIGKVNLSFNYDLGQKEMWPGFLDGKLVHPLRNRNATLAIGYKFIL